MASKEGDLERLAGLVVKMVQQGQNPLGETARAPLERAFNADAAGAVAPSVAPSPATPAPLPDVSAPGADGLNPMQRWQLEQARSQIRR